MMRDVRFFLLLIVFFACGLKVSPGQQTSVYKKIEEDNLANGESFPFWEKHVDYSDVYHVDRNHPSAHDRNPGTEDQPFKTISRAAEVLQPGEKVIIHEGVYRESVHPARGGTAPDKLIAYEAEEDEKVVVKGSVVLPSDEWQPATGWKYGNPDKHVEVWEFDLSNIELNGYNPFGMLNLMHDREHFQYKKEVNMRPHFKRRGMIFLNGKPIEQVLKPVELASKDSGAFWVEHNGLTVHLRFPHNTSPDDFLIEASVKEQLFVPKKYGLGYIKLKGLTFTHAANGFPVPQRGMVSSNRGNHWIIENCVIEWANSLGIDLGNEMWHTEDQPGLGYHIIRGNIIRHCGISGLQAMNANTLLVEDNLFEHIGWRDAELAFESGGIKFHRANNTLIRRNVFRNITYAPGIWMDYHSNNNCRITRNVFTNITTARGGVYIEVCHRQGRVDHNFFHNLDGQYWLSGDPGAGGSALYTDGSDSLIFDHNFALDMENSGYTDYINAKRIVGMRGGITRWHKILNNIFIDCRTHTVEVANKYNFLNNNWYSLVNPGYIKIGNPAPPLLLDLKACRKLYGWEEKGKITDLKAIFNSEELTLTVKSEKENLRGGNLSGPFKTLELNNVSIDPRKQQAYE
jgi:hypothetical protein